MFSPRTFLAVVIRPILWWTALGAWLSFAQKSWWLRPPFLPIPDRSVIAWRVTTAYGRPDMTLAADDVVSYLRWRRTVY